MGVTGLDLSIKISHLKKFTPANHHPLSQYIDRWCAEVGGLGNELAGQSSLMQHMGVTGANRPRIPRGLFQNPTNKSSQSARLFGVENKRQIDDRYSR